MPNKVTSSIISIGAAFTLAACTTTDPHTGAQKTSNTAKGAAIGAVVGAIAGAVVNDDEAEGALIGGILGAGIGGGIGQYMDRQEAALRERLAQSDIDVNRVGDRIELIMPGNVTFATNSSNIEPGFYGTLNEVSQVLTEFDQTTIQVEGHTDSVGSDEYNTALSIRRAETVGNYLATQGVAASRIDSLGFGESQPVDTNETDTGRSRNRRVEINITPLGENQFTG